jgi:hypothetical protein
MTLILHQLSLPSVELVLLKEETVRRYRMQLTSRMTGQWSIVELGDDEAYAEAVYHATAAALYTFTSPHHGMLSGIPLTKLD